MSRFKKKGSGKMAPISTASLPDIVFMLLFFFMVSTVMRDSTLMVENKLPQATEIKKIERKSLVDYIFVGKPKDETYGTNAKIQLNDAFADVEDIKFWVHKNRDARREEERPYLTAAFKSDVNTNMGVISDIKEELVEVRQYKVMYSANKGSAKK
ncbi:MAG: ExbD/TolR family protein [Flavobacteriales bacterium]